MTDSEWETPLKKTKQTRTRTQNSANATKTKHAAVRRSVRHTASLKECETAKEAETAIESQTKRTMHCHFEGVQDNNQTSRHSTIEGV